MEMIKMEKAKEAIREIAEAKGLDENSVVEAIKEALKKAYIKSLGVVDADDANVEVDFDLDTGSLSCRQLKKVVSEVNDDFLEIDIEEANKGRKKKDYYKEGDLYPIECPLEEMSKIFVKSVMGNFSAILRQAERLALYDIYKDHIGEMIIGTVEKCDDRSCFVNIGRTTVELTRRDMIGDEFFKQGDPIKVYIQEVKSASNDPKNVSKGPQIEVTRSSEGFLKRLFEEEIHEIFEGTVIIKGIAREAGNRSKVAVYSRMEDIDATGACIGAGGSRIQKIVNQLGNSAKDREKIDIIAWSNNPGLYIAESLRPANVIGVALEEQEEGQRPSATAIVKDGQLSLAIGKKGANARLANKLTGWNIDIVEESIAAEDQIEFKSVDELRHEAEEEDRIAQRALLAKQMASQKNVVDSSEITYAEKAEENEAEEVEEAIVSEAEKAEVKEEKVEAKEEKPATPTINVKTTTTLEDLESLIESAKSKPAKGEKKSKRPRKITEEEVEHAKPTATQTSAPSFAMPIYSAEEIEEIEAEEREWDSSEDYDEIDDTYDDYYEE